MAVEKSTKPVPRKTGILQESGNIQPSLVCPDTRKTVPRRIISTELANRGGNSSRGKSTKDRNLVPKPRISIASRTSGNTTEGTDKEGLDLSRLSTILEATEVT